MLDIRQGDCREVMAGMEPASVDAIVTDPPYGLEFMGKEWDAPWKYGFSEYGMKDTKGRRAGPVFGSSRNPMCRNCHKHKRGSKRHIPCSCAAPQFDELEHRMADAVRLGEWHHAWATAALRVAKPGAHLVAFGGTRTYHRLTCAIEDAGWEVRDCLSWLYGSGFPKSLDVSKAIDKAAGRDREDKFEGSFTRRAGPTGNRKCDVCKKWLVSGSPCQCPRPQDAAQTEEAQQWEGWGTALKPAWEPIILARKPLVGTVAANVHAHGTGALNVDGCRIPTGDALGGGAEKWTRHTGGWDRPWMHDPDHQARKAASTREAVEKAEAQGRWPANVVLDEEAARMLDEQSGQLASGANPERRSSDKHRGVYQGWKGEQTCLPARGFDAGGASRFFYTAKAGSAERHAAGKNAHPTVKPVDLMRWLCRLVTPPGGLVLDPFAGSGSTGIAALAEGFRFVGIELNPDYCELARRRIAGPLFAEGLTTGA